MNYLEMVNKVLRRLNEVELTVATFPSARGIHAAAKDAVQDAVNKINSQKFEWPFNYVAGSQVLVAGQIFYTWPAALKVVDWDTFYIEKSDLLGTNTKVLPQISKEQWAYMLQQRDRDGVADGGLRIPDFVFEAQNGGFGVTPTPDAAYTVKFTYFTRTTQLDVTADASVELSIPEEWSHVILDGALEFMYLFLDNDARADYHGKLFDTGLNYMAYTLVPRGPKVYGNVVNFGGGAQYSRQSSLGYLKDT